MRAVEPWKTLSSCQLADYRIARMRSVRREHPLTKKEHEFYVLDCPDWVLAEISILSKIVSHSHNALKCQAMAGQKSD